MNRKIQELEIEIESRKKHLLMKQNMCCSLLDSKMGLMLLSLPENVRVMSMKDFNSENKTKNGDVSYLVKMISMNQNLDEESKRKAIENLSQVQNLIQL